MYVLIKHIGSNKEVSVGEYAAVRKKMVLEYYEQVAKIAGPVEIKTEPMAEDGINGIGGLLKNNAFALNTDGRVIMWEIIDAQNV